MQRLAEKTVFCDPTEKEKLARKDEEGVVVHTNLIQENLNPTTIQKLFGGTENTFTLKSIHIYKNTCIYVY